MGSIDDVKRMTAELQKQTDLMRSIAQSCKAQATIEYLTKLNLCGSLSDSVYCEELLKVGKQLLGRDNS